MTFSLKTVADYSNPIHGFALCEICDNYTPVCEECYDANWPADADCALCHNAYGCDEDLI